VLFLGYALVGLDYGWAVCWCGFAGWRGDGDWEGITIVMPWLLRCGNSRW
jgi:hypothetical protein